MTVSAAGVGAGAPQAPVLNAVLDMALLVLAVLVASDALVNIGPAQVVTWLACYGLVLLRIVMTAPGFVSLLMRNRLVMGYPLICLASAFWSYTPLGSLISAAQLTMTVLIASYLGWRYSLVILLKVFATLMTMAAALSLLHWATGIFPWPTHTGAGGLAGLFLHKNMLGLRALFTITILAGLLLLRREEPGWTPGWLLWLAMGINGMALGLAQSGTALMLAPVMVGVVLLAGLRRVPGLIALVGVSVALGGVALGPLALGLAGINPATSLLEALGKDATLTGRTLLWDIALGVSADHPWLGTGFRAFWVAPEFTHGRMMTYDAGARDAASFHNFVLEVLVSVGWPGLVLMLGAIVAGCERLIRLALLDGRPSAGMGLALLVGIVATALVTTSLFRGHEIMMMMMPLLVVAAGEDLRHARACRADRDA